MNGIHDMGGMHGFGPVLREEHEPVFHQPWEGRVFAMQRATPVPIPGGSRHNIEQMDPIHYLTSSYYEKWLHARLKGLLDAGVLTAAELEARMAYYRDNPQAPVPRRADPALVQRVLQGLRTHRSPFRDLPIEPKYQVGAAVRVRNMHPPGHTRLPRYVRGKCGTVTRFYGICDLQDTMPLGVEPPAEPVYVVRFAAQELWGDAAEVNSILYIDMWESYLELP
jgi:nitrile hydratase subunit beta